jgi:lipoprotein-releasing system ATP-binding protein
MLEAKDIRKKYRDLEVLKGINLTIQKGEVVSIVGASGAGKSTLLHILGTLDTPDQGKVYLNNQELSRLKGNEMARFRNKHMGFIFQFHNLLPEFTALENVCMPAFIANEPLKKAEQKAMELMKILGVENRKDHKPSQLSGGEQQRTAVARALINSPSIVFADEPSGNLDSMHAEDLHNLFFKLRNELGQTFVIVTHNEHLAEMADRKIEMKDGLVLI